MEIDLKFLKEIEQCQDKKNNYKNQGIEKQVKIDLQKGMIQL